MSHNSTGPVLVLQPNNKTAENSEQDMPALVYMKHHLREEMMLSTLQKC